MSASADLSLSKISSSHRVSEQKKNGLYLTGDQAIAIFLQKPNSGQIRHRSSTAVAQKYGVSSKTVRDIWCARTWHLQTMHLDPMRPQRPPARPGRPRGSKDKAPRRFNAKHHPNQQAADAADARGPEDACALFDNEDENDPFHHDWQHWDRAAYGNLCCDSLLWYRKAY